MSVYETLINLIQSVIFSYFIIEFYVVKKKWNVYFAMGISVFTLFVYLEVQNYITQFEGMFVFVTIFMVFLLSNIFCEGTIQVKILFSALVVLVAIISALISGFIIGLYMDKKYLDLVSEISLEHMTGQILTQVIFAVGILILLKFKIDKEIKYDSVFIRTFLPIPLISMIIVILQISENSDVYFVRNSFIILGVVILNILSFTLIKRELKQYEVQRGKELEIQAYQAQVASIQSVILEYEEIQKSRHENKRIMNMLYDYLSSHRQQDAVDYLKQFESNTVNTNEQKIYTDHVILNYLLNRVMSQCVCRNIDAKFVVIGKINGIDDADLNIMVGNLCENAIEATEGSKKPYISLNIQGDDNKIRLEICNYSDNRVLINNPEFKTTKRDSKGHGYGIKNIRTIVRKYNGEIKYCNVDNNIVKCSVSIEKFK